MTNNFKTAIPETLSKPASRLASTRGLHLLRIQVRGTESAPVIEVLLDGDRPILIDDCESVSKELSSEIDSAKLIKGNYRLDVMSPGLEEPLVEDWQFARSLGRLVEAQYQDDSEHHSLHGHLRAYTPKEIAIEPIHIKTPKVVKPNVVATDSGPITLEQDEQIYNQPVELVKIERRHLTKVVAQPEFGR
jgi:ribosome maturation factor RimP